MKVFLWGPDYDTALMWHVEALVWTRNWFAGESFPGDNLFLRLDLALCHITG